MSRTELERRWELARRCLKARNLDALVAVSGDAILSGYTRWFTDAPFSYRKVVVFYPDGPMTIIEHGAAGSVRTFSGDDPDYPGVGEVISVAEFPSVHYSQDHEARELVKVFSRRGVRAVGLVNPGAMPHRLVEALRAGLPNAIFHDVTEAIDRCKAIKSPEELELIRSAAAMQDACFERVLAEARPGMRDLELSALMQEEGRLRGGEGGGVVLAGSAPLGQPAHFQAEYKQGRVLQEGDHFSVLIENSGPGAYFLELVRTVVLGRAPAQLLEAFEIVKQAQAHTLGLCRPGTPFADIYRAHNSYMAKYGQPEERRLYAHGQGYDLVERPLVREDETMTVEEGMCLTVHPSYARPDLWITITDNYMIGSNGPGECLHATEKRVFEA